jgi:CPA2 family monovalent cation:H+ antiporter-2
MHETLPVLRELVLLAGLSLVVSLVFGRLRLPAVTGFIITGALIGPGGFGLIEDPGTIHTLAEIGVVVLLFTVGLEFSLADLRALGVRTAVAGALQILLTALLLAPALVLAGLHPAQALFFGFAAAISSTTLLLKITTDRGELHAPHGRLLMGVSLVQDLSLVPLTLLTPMLAGWAQGRLTLSVGSQEILHVLFGSAAAGLVVYGAWRWMPWLLGQASRTRSREVFLAGIALVVLGSAFLSDKFGLSLALGAFLAGLILAGSDVSSQVAADLLPFRDTLSSVFFLSIGMLFSPEAVARHWGLAVGVTLALIAIKFLAALLGARVAKIPGPVALAAALGLAHVGEFAFVLVQTGSGAGLLPGDWGQVFVASALFTLLLGPFLTGSASRWAAAYYSRPGSARSREEVERSLAATPSAALHNHVVIAGFGLNGSNVARVLRAVRIPHVVVEQAPDKIAACGAQGSPALLGNAAQPEILERAGIAHARAFVIALSDPTSTRHACRLGRQLHPGVFIVVRTRYVREVDSFYDVGANVVIPEEFETSIEIFTVVLRQYHVPMNIIDAQITLLRRERYSVLRGQKLPGSVVEQLDEIMAQGTTETARIMQHSPGVGRTLGELGLDPAGPGCRVVAIVRGGRAITTLDAGFKVQAGDTLVLLGAHREIDEALERLAPPERTAAQAARGWPGEDPPDEA